MTALPSFAAASDPSAGQLQALLPIFARKANDSSPPVNNSITLVNDPDLIWGLGGSDGLGTYEFHLTIIYNTNSTANLKWALLTPASARVDFAVNGLKTGGTNTLDTLGVVAYSSGTAFNQAGTGADATLRIDGTIGMGGVPGNLQVQFAQNTANVSNTVLRAGAFGVCRQVK